MENNSFVQNASLQVLLAAGGFALVVILGFVWHFRARAARRLHAVLDAYANREMSRRPEQAQRIYSRRNLHARPQSQNR